MNKLLIILAFFCLKVDGQVLNIFPEEPVSTWHPGSVLNVFGNYETWSLKMLISYMDIHGYIDYTPARQDSILARLSENYVINTFGPEGLDKDVCDFFLYFENSNTTTPLTEKSNSKTGAILRWNYGNGNIYNQNYLPAQINNGTITVTSADGFGAWTYFNISNNSFTLIPSNWQYFTAISIFYPYTNALNQQISGFDDNTTLAQLYLHSGNNLYPIPYLNNKSNLQHLLIYDNDSISEIPSLSGTNLGRFWCYNTNITTYTNSTYTTNLYEFRGQNSGLKTSELDKILSDLNTSFYSNHPIKNLLLYLYGSANQSPTGGLFNHDLVDLNTIYTNAGYILTDSINSYSHNKANPLLPDTIFLPVGDTFRIWQDEMIFKRIIPTYTYTYTYTCDIGAVSGTSYLFVPTSQTVGNHNFSVVIKYESTPIDTATTIVKIFQRSTGSNVKKIMMVGNSLVDNYPYILDSFYYNVTGFNPQMCGQFDSNPLKHEAISGTGISYWGNTSSKFYIGGKFDVDKFVHDTLGLTGALDVVIIQLGINDLTLNTQDFLYINTSIIPKIKNLVDAFIADTTTHIILCCSPKCENSGAGWIANYPTGRDQNFYLEKMHYLWQKLLEIYGNGRYHPSVEVIMPALNVDRNNDYPKTGGVHTNAVHPNIWGGTHIAQGMLNYVEYIYK